MPTVEHEAILGLFRNRSGLAAELLREALNVELPEFDAVGTASTEFTAPSALPTLRFGTVVPPGLRPA